MPSLVKIACFRAGIKTPIVVTEQSGNDLVDYPIKVELDSEWSGWSYVSRNGADIYFIDDRGHPLYFYFEKYDYDNKSAVIWVKIPSLPANQKKTIYMVYGGVNPYPEYCNPNKVFIRFTNFESGLPSWISKKSGIVTPNVVNYNPYEGNYCFGNTNPSGTTGTSDVMLWGITVSLPRSFRSVVLRVYERGERYQSFWHQHLLYNGTLFRDLYTPYTSQSPINNSWTAKEFIINPNTEFTSIGLEYHKDHSTYLRYVPAIFIDLIMVRPYIEPEPSIEIKADILPVTELDLK